MSFPARMARSLLSALAALTLASCPAASQARPATLDDVLGREGVGVVQIDPTGRWLALERRGPIARAARFDLDALDLLARTTLWRVDLRRPGPLRRLVPMTPGAAYGLGPFSPDGRRVVVYRLRARAWELGVATLATGTVRWLRVTPERVEEGRTVAWTPSGALFAIVRPSGDLPPSLRTARAGATFLPDRWRRSARGEAVVSVYGSGRFLRLRPPSPPRRLLRIDPATGGRRVLATGAFIDLAPSPDGRRIALVEADGEIPLDAGRPVQGPYGFASVAHRLRILDTGDGRLAAPCPGGDILHHPLAWSDAGALLLFARRDGEPWTAGRLHLVEPGAALARVIPRDVAPGVEGRPEAVRAGWLRDQPLVWGAPPSAPENAGWHRLTGVGPVALTEGLVSPRRDATALDGDGLLVVAEGAVWRVDGRGRRRLVDGVEPLSPPQPNRLWRFDYDLAGDGALRVRRPREGFDEILRVTAGGATVIGRAPPGAEVLAAAPPGVLVRRITAGAAEALDWLSAEGRSVRIAALNPTLADLSPADLRPVRHPGPSGEPLTSWLLLPPHAPGDPPPPLVIRPYLGLAYAAPPADADLRRPFGDPTAPLLAGHGYAVLFPSLPLPPDDREPAAGVAGRLLAIVRAAADAPETKGTFDPERLGIWGLSFGGYTTLAALTQTDRFKAAIAEAAMSDLFSQWGTFTPKGRIDPAEGLSPFYSEGWVEDVQPRLGVPPWSDPARYVRNSPAWQADKVTTPLLLLHGSEDGFSTAQPEEMFSALLRQGKDAELAIYWGQGHVIGGPGALRDLYARAFDWLDRHLMAGSSRPAGPPPASRGLDPASGARRPRSPPSAG